jgi:hypothetical protein
MREPDLGSAPPNLIWVTVIGLFKPFPGDPCPFVPLFAQAPGASLGD